MQANQVKCYKKENIKKMLKTNRDRHGDEILGDLKVGTGS